MEAVDAPRRRVMPVLLLAEAPMRTLVLSSIAASVVALSPAAAQSFRTDDTERPIRRPSRAFAGVQLAAMRPVGDFDQGVDLSGGVGAHLLYRLTPSGSLALRADAGFFFYGRERKHVSLGPQLGRISTDIVTSNSYVFAGVGPQIAVPSGRFSLYLNGTAGVKYLATSSSLAGENSEDGSFGTTNFDAAAFAWAAGGGVYIPVRRGLRPVSIDLGARYHGGPEVRYLVKGDIIDTPDGISFDPRHTRTDMITYQVGITAGF
jgi:hypothetical protein